MAPKVIGAGLGRTGTTSLKAALEQLLGAPCYHMSEVIGSPRHIRVWTKALDGDTPDWPSFFSGYAAVVDWPAAAFLPELIAAFPESKVVLSVRDSGEWWDSAAATIFRAMAEADGSSWHAMFSRILQRSSLADISDRHACVSAFESHCAMVRKAVPPDRLLVWRAEDGWAPICELLGLAVPCEIFPRHNTRQEFVSKFGW
jgi:Sulfotransferase domain